jgi:hypothetical protein
MRDRALLHHREGRGTTGRATRNRTSIGMGGATKQGHDSFMQWAPGPIHAGSAGASTATMLFTSPAFFGILRVPGIIDYQRCFAGSSWF